MLAYILALTVGLGSLAIYMAAFFFPEIHRKNDFIWSGVGLFYALVLWVCAGRITGGLLLGQVAGVALLGWSVTQTLSLRRQLTPRQQQTELPSAEEVKNTVQEKVSNLSLGERLSQLQQRVTGTATGVKDRTQQTLSKTIQKPKTPEAQTTQPPSAPLTAARHFAQAEEPPHASGSPTAATGEAIPPPPLPTDTVQVIDNRTWTPEAGAARGVATLETESQPELKRPNPPDPELVEAARESATEADALTTEDSPVPVEEIAPEAQLAPPAEAPPEKMPPIS
jgi:hypothetical protein